MKFRFSQAEWDQLDVAIGMPIDHCEPIDGTAGIDRYRLLAGSHHWLLKRSDDADRVAAELDGLKAIEATGTVPVPPTRLAAPGWLLIEWLMPAGDANWARLGRDLAAMHRQTGPHHGWHRANYIGALPQVNEPRPSWPEFYGSQRLMPQLEIAQQQRVLPLEALRAGVRLADRLDHYLPKDPPSLLHGDLWPGNVIGGAKGRLYAIDPAVAYGSRELDLAFSRLFPGFPPAFYRAYEEAWPLADEFGERRDLLMLYHLLVHANLYGAPYDARAAEIIRRYGWNG